MVSLAMPLPVVFLVRFGIVSTHSRPSIFFLATAVRGSLKNARGKKAGAKKVILVCRLSANSPNPGRPPTCCERLRGAHTECLRVDIYLARRCRALLFFFLTR